MSKFSIQRISKKLSSCLENDKSDKKEVLFALYDYAPAFGSSKYLKFIKNDEFILYSEEDQRWWVVKHLPSGNTGLVPKQYVAKINEKEFIQWCNLEYSRKEAEKELRKNKYCNGAFIIRSFTTTNNLRALEICIKSKVEGSDFKIFRYLILRENGHFKLRHEQSEEICQNNYPQFPTMTNLIHYYARYPCGDNQRIEYSVKKKLVIDVWEIDPTEIEIGEKLGEGNYGEVRKGILDKREVAVKTLRGSHMNEEQFIKEAQIARQCSHENIVETIGICSAVPFIVTEFMQGGDLKKFLSVMNNSNQKQSYAQNLSIAIKIVSAMAHLEKNGIVHRDLAARNILVGQSIDVVKLADFGLARCLDDSLYYKNNKGGIPYKWTAPEALLIFGADGKIIQSGKSTSASDVWSFAVVLWEVYSRGAMPYRGQSWSEIYKDLTENGKRLACPTDCPHTIYKKMLECWSLDPSERPKFSQLRTFFDDYSVEKEETKSATRIEKIYTPLEVTTNARITNAYIPFLLE